MNVREALDDLVLVANLAALVNSMLLGSGYGCQLCIFVYVNDRVVNLRGDLLGAGVLFAGNLNKTLSASLEERAGIAIVGKYAYNIGRHFGYYRCVC